MGLRLGHHHDFFVFRVDAYYYLYILDLGCPNHILDAYTHTYSDDLFHLELQLILVLEHLVQQ